MLVDVRSPQGVAVWKRSSVVHDDSDWRAHRLVADQASLSLRPETSSQAEEEESDLRRAAPHQSQPDRTLVLALQVREEATLRFRRESGVVPLPAPDAARNAALMW
jgi:hypothetical protein